MEAEVRHADNVRYQHLHETVCGLNGNDSITLTFDRSSGSIGDSQFVADISIIEDAVC